VFDDAAWADDMSRATEAARTVAQNACEEFEADGVRVGELRACDSEGPAGTQLQTCVKVYLPAPVGPHGMVFEIVCEASSRLGLTYVGSGCDTRRSSHGSRRSTRSHTDGSTGRQSADPPDYERNSSANSASIRDRRMDRRRASASSRV
jgi:hypothetical protein